MLSVISNNGRKSLLRSTDLKVLMAQLVSTSFIK